MELPFPTDIPGFILWLATGGATIALLLDKIPAWLNWSSPAKKYVTLALFIALPFISKLLGALYAQLDPAIAAQVQEYLNLALGGLVLWGGGQVAHKFVNKA